MVFKILFWPYHVACGILVPQPGIELAPPALEAQSLNHGTCREVPELSILEAMSFSFQGAVFISLYLL